MPSRSGACATAATTGSSCLARAATGACAARPSCTTRARSISRRVHHPSLALDQRTDRHPPGSLANAKKAAARNAAVDSLKLPPALTRAHSTTRSKDWDGPLTARADEGVARTWSVPGERLGQHAFVATPAGKAQVASVKARLTLPPSALPLTRGAQAVCVSACGNFGLAGTAAGAIEMWNVRSGARRKTFALGPAPAARRMRRRHALSPGSRRTRSITSLPQAHSTGRSTSVSFAARQTRHAANTRQFFDFHSAALEYTLVLPSNAVALALHRGSGLLAVVCDDLPVRVVDVETHRVVRELGRFGGRIINVVRPARAMCRRAGARPAGVLVRRALACRERARRRRAHVRRAQRPPPRRVPCAQRGHQRRVLAQRGLPRDRARRQHRHLPLVRRRARAVARIRSPLQSPHRACPPHSRTTTQASSHLSSGSHGRGRARCHARALDRQLARGLGAGDPCDRPAPHHRLLPTQRERPCASSV
jgi:hypothetical protein